MMIEVEDRKGFYALLAAAILFTTLPYIIALASQGKEWVFSGFFIGIEDGNSYLAKMLSGSFGAWLFKSPFTTYNQNGIFAFLPYLLLGKLASPPALHIQLILLFQLFRWVGIVIYFTGIYKFITLFISNRQYRMFALALSAFGGGLGWLFPILGTTELFGTIPLDFYSPETFGFLSLYSLPHLAAARGLMFFALALYISGRSDFMSSSWRKSLPGFMLLLSGVFQPLNAAIGLVLIILFAASDLLNSKSVSGGIGFQLKQLLIATFAVIPIIAYYGIAQFSDPFYKEWTAQNIITSPHPVHYFLAFAIPIVVLILNKGSLTSIIKTTKGFFLVSWIMSFLALAYIPYNLQRRLPDGIFVALLVLVFLVLEQIKNRISGKFINAIGLLMIPSTLIIIANGINSGINQFEPIFIPRERADAYLQFADHIENGSHVISNYHIGNELPSWAPIFVVVGHGPESINKQAALMDLDSFFGPVSSDTVRKEILQKYDVDYVIKEKKVNYYPSDFDQLPCYLEFIIDNSVLELYKVTHCE